MAADLIPNSAKGPRPNRLTEEIEEDEKGLPGSVPIHAKKWIDYTSKYGLGYVLSDGAVGVFFNDATKIILDPAGVVFEYHE